MRVQFVSKEVQKQFFKNSKSKNKTWKEFYNEILNLCERKFSFWAFRNWKKGERLAPLEIIQIIRKISQVDFNKLSINLKPENWGVILGGKRKSQIYECNLTKSQRTKGGKNGIQALRQKFGKEKMRQVASYAGMMSIKSNKRFARKVFGPRGEKMYNNLEKNVAEILLKTGMNYEYEKVLKLNNQYIIPDFMVNDIIIECTYFSNLIWVSKRLKNRFKLLQSLGFNKIILITTQKLKKKFIDKLGNKISILTPQELSEWFITES